MGDRLVSKLDHMLEPETVSVHRLEVITGMGRRRRFSDEYKARVVEEALAPGAVVSQIARRHGLTPQQLFGWRRQARETASAETGDRAPMFVPAVVEPAPTPMAAPAMRENQADPRRSGILAARQA
ncbi:MAG: transposase [Pseudolabrys sp.]|nr:transposase [Pseudolabrys sp.]